MAAPQDPGLHLFSAGLLLSKLVFQLKGPRLLCRRAGMIEKGNFKIEACSKEPHMGCCEGDFGGKALRVFLNCWPFLREIGNVTGATPPD